MDLVAREMTATMLLGTAIMVVAQAAASAGAASTGPLVLSQAQFQQRTETFNRDDQELYVQFLPNAAAWEFLRANVPQFDCPDPDIAEIFAFRWWTFRKHIKQTPDGFVITEFLPPVPWAGKHNTINCPAMHHFREGRWLRNGRFLDDYSTFWLRKGGAVRSYSFPIADALVARAQASGDARLAIDLLPDLIRNYEAWERDHRDANGLYWQTDDRDGGEISIGGNGYRATINSYQYADAMAIARLSRLAGKGDVAAGFEARASELASLVVNRLWDTNAQFFKVRPRGENTKLADVRELYGFAPWYVGLARPEMAPAWAQLMDPRGFFAPFGPTTAERRHPGFKLSYEGHECQWNGPSWPFATCITLTALANLLNGPPQAVISRSDYLKLLQIYARSQHRTREDGMVVPWIDENLNPDTGDWIARTVLQRRGGGIRERGKDYNHSTFCDLVITGLVGLRPRLDDTLEINPLVPDETWDFFCLDSVPYHGHSVTVVYDRLGDHYHKGRGLRAFVDGKEVAASEKLTRLTAALPDKVVMGGKL